MFCVCCEEQIFVSQKFVLFKVDSPRKVNVESVMYHAGCFMDIVNSISDPVRRTDIEEGNIKRIDGDYYLVRDDTEGVKKKLDVRE